ncbi:helix-turn-helix domain-containing protein [Pelomonas sp. SE-A7]|uniref:AraC family transcriptional regulator n=1 Tax=Pelomonas sp. SE-A7 TaxID=3054953 RepID=UPI00259CA867|nr:helix-turn-helix domain-containing protein [Pelomonas sp. SE-A7]MDM4768517.1 helix-turn-helix domain-containing protein [Pelomonas sp. SE-A7]
MTEPAYAALLIDAALRGAVLALMGVTAWLMLRDRAGFAAVRLGVALAAGLAVQVVSSMPWFECQVPRAWQAPLVGVSVANGLLFWLFTAALFDEEFRPRRWQAGAWLAVAALGTSNCLLALPEGSPSMLLQRWLPVLFALLAIRAALRPRRADLVERRRRLALYLAVAGSVYTVVLVALRLASPQGRLSEGGAVLDMALLLLLVAGLAWKLLGVAPNELLPAAPAPLPAEPPPVDAEERAQAEQMRQRVEAEGLFRQEELGIGQLADRLGLPEYRLRRLINQQLGHRNFNAFINGFRLAAARAALADPARREESILAIALEAGFGSIGPFNRAFKAETGLTPSEFRRQALADC